MATIANRKSLELETGASGEAKLTIVVRKSIKNPTFIHTGTWCAIQNVLIYTKTQCAIFILCKMLLEKFITFFEVVNFFGVRHPRAFLFNFFLLIFKLNLRIVFIFHLPDLDVNNFKTMINCVLPSNTCGCICNLCLPLHPRESFLPLFWYIKCGQVEVIEKELEKKKNI